MFGADNIQTVSWVINDPAATNKQIFLMRAPVALEITGARAIAQNAGGAGTASSYALHIYSTASTPALAGTVAAAVGGTASATRFAAGVPQTYTISEGTLAAGQWLVCQYDETNDNTEVNVTIHVDYVLGVGA